MGTFLLWFQGDTFNVVQHHFSRGVLQDCVITLTGRVANISDEIIVAGLGGIKHDDLDDPFADPLLAGKRGINPPC